MSFELILPKRVNEPSFESFLIQADSIAHRPKTLILEMGPVETIDLYGMLSLLELGRLLRQRGHRVLLHQPLSAELQQHLERAGFFAQARLIYTIYPPYRKSVPPSQNKNEGFLLGITPVQTREDRARALERLRERMEGREEGVSTNLSALLSGLLDRDGGGGYAAVRSDSSGYTIAASDRGALRPGGLAKVTVIVLP
jgi:hypothetical protein